MQRFRQVHVTELNSIGEVLASQYLFALGHVPFPEAVPVVASWLATYPRALVRKNRKNLIHTFLLLLST